MLSLSSFKSERVKLKNFLYSIKGVFYYNTPHHGVSMLDNDPTIENNPLLTYFQTMSKDAKRLNQEFGQLQKVHAKWRIHGVGTNIPTNLGRLGNIEIGFEVSGRDGDSYNVISGVDHYDICKPQDKNSRSYYALTNLVKTIASDTEVVHLCHDLQDFCPGLENLVQAVEEKLKNKKVIAIVGMGGVGKTTLAKKLFNNISREYECTCFVDNVKDIPSDNLKRKLLDEFYCNGIGVKSNQMDWSHLKGKKTLLVMDDVDSVDQLNCLPASLAAFGNGSHLIITSRYRDILNHSKYYADSEIYDVDLLGDADAKKLFCYHAFGSENIPSNLVEYVETIVRKCQGLPLTLEVLGCYLRGCKDSDYDLEIWKETIAKLGEAEAVQGGEKDDRVWARLRISYDKKLSQEEQEMFIDAATFFFGQPVERALVAWSTAHGNPHSRWKNLLSTSMVKVKEVRDSDEFEHEIKLEEVWVHECLRDLANKISKAEVSSMWDAVDNTPYTRRSLGLWKNGLRLLWTLDSEDRLQLDLLDKMENLKYLEVAVSPTGLGKKFPRKLSLLSWTGNADEDSRDLLPINLEELSDLAILELSQLKVLEEFSEALGSLKNLHTLSLSSLQGMHHLPTNFGKLSRLKRLELRKLSIPTLPVSFGDLRALKYLECEGLGLSELPESFGSLSLLKHLILREESLKSLPNSFSKLLRLESLKIHSDSLKELGDCFGNLRALSWLEINCEQLKTLPESFGELLGLRGLKIHAKSLEKLPDNFGRLSALEELELVQCDQLKTLPESFGELLGLRSLKIYGQSLKKLPDNFGRLSALEELKLVQCDQLQSLPENFGELLALQSLRIYGQSLKKLPDNFGRLSALEELKLVQCDQLKTLPENFGELLALRSLEIDAKSLEKLPDNFRRLSALEELELVQCDQLKTLPENFGELLGLRSLKIHAKSLEKLPDNFGRLSALEELELVQCDQLKTLPENFVELLALRSLEIHAKSLEKLPDSFGRLSALEKLEFSHCKQLQRLPDDFGQLKALKTLQIRDTSQLKVLPDGFGLLSSLEKLEFFACGQLQTLSDNFRQLVALKELQLSGEVPLEVLDHIETLGNFSSLEVLRIWMCPTLETLPESVGHISSLRTLDLWRCERIKNLPDSLGKPRLTQLAISQEDSPVEGNSSKITATEGVRVKVKDCLLLDASILQRLGWVKSKNEDDVYVYQRRSESGDASEDDPDPVLGTLNCASGIVYSAEDFRREIDEGGEDGYFVSSKWLLNLEKHERENLMSVLQRAGYSETRQKSTTTLFARIENVGQNMIPHDGEPRSSTNVDEVGEPKEGDNLLGVGRQGLNIGKSADIADVRGSNNPAETGSSIGRGSSTLEEEKSNQISPAAGENPGAIGSKSFKAALQSRNHQNFHVSTEWLCNLKDQEREAFEAGYKKVRETKSTTWYEKISGQMRNPTGEGTCDNDSRRSSDRNEVTGGAMKSKTFESGGFPGGRQIFNDEDNSSDSLSMKCAMETKLIQDGYSTCHPQLLNVRCSSPSQTSMDLSAIGDFNRKQFGDTIVTMPGTDRSQNVSTAIEIPFVLMATNFAGGRSNEVPIKLKAIASTKLNCCARIDHHHAKVRLKFPRICGEVKNEESEEEEEEELCHEMVLSSLYTSVYGCMKSPTNRNITSDQIVLNLEDEYYHHPRRRVLATAKHLEGDSTASADRMWLEISGRSPNNCEPGSTTLVLRADIKGRRKDDSLRQVQLAEPLLFQDPQPVILEGDVQESHPDSFLEFHIRHKLDVSYFRLCRQEERLFPEEGPVWPIRRVTRAIDFGCCLEMRTKGLLTPQRIKSTPM